MKGLVIIISVSILLLPARLGALGIGMSRELAISGSLTDKIQLTMSFGDGSTVAAVGGATGADSLYYTLALDRYLAIFNPSGALRLYAGIGGYAEIGERVATGLRLPAGVSIAPIEILEFYLEGAPAGGIEIDDALRLSRASLQAAAGFRIRF